MLETAWKVFKYGVFSDLYFSVFWLNTVCIRTEYGPEQTLYLDTFQAVEVLSE